ncbi:hypothetical protein [Rubritalea tangerina]
MNIHVWFSQPARTLPPYDPLLSSVKSGKSRLSYYSSHSLLDPSRRPRA